MSKWVAMAVLACGVLPAVGEEARGTVFRDDNGNGVRDSGEPGIAEVRGVERSAR